MTVKELIEMLSHMNPEANVSWYVGKGAFSSLEPEDVKEGTSFDAGEGKKIPVVILGYTYYGVKDAEQISKSRTQDIGD